VVALLFRPLDYATGEQLLGLEVVEDIAVCLKHAGDFFHGFNPRAHSLVAPFGEEFACPSWELVFSELLEVPFDQIGAEGLQVEAKQIPETEPLLPCEILFPFEETPARFLQ